LKRFISAVLLFLSGSVGVFAQTSTAPAAPAPKAADTQEAYWTVSIHGNYSDVSGAQTNNGVKSGADVRIAQHFLLGAEYLTTINPANTKIFLAGGDYYRNLGHLGTKSQFIDLSQFDISFGPKAGFSLQNGVKKFAFSFGGKLDRHVGNNVVLRLLDVEYVRAAVLPNGGQLIGNHVNVGAGLGLQF
jgi:hypothetical protein